MRMEQARCAIVDFGRKMIESGLTHGTGGNLSVADRALGLMAITPSGVSYERMTPDQVVLLDLASGAPVEGGLRPSSEWEMHRLLYQERADLSALVHTHSRFAVTVACMGWTLPPVHYLVALAGPNVRCAPYAPYGTPELARLACEGMRARRAVLLQNHGLLAGGETLETAFSIAEEMEFCCEIYCRTRALGGPVLLSDAEMERMTERFKSYGQPPDAHNQP